MFEAVSCVTNIYAQTWLFPHVFYLVRLNCLKSQSFLQICTPKERYLMWGDFKYQYQYQWTTQELCFSAASFGFLILTISLLFFSVRLFVWFGLGLLFLFLFCCWTITISVLRLQIVICVPAMEARLLVKVYLNSQWPQWEIAWGIVLYLMTVITCKELC